MSFIASLIAAGTETLLAGTVLGGALGATGTAAVGGALGGAATGAAMEGIRSGVTGTDFDPTNIGIGAVTGGALGGLGAIGNAATAAESGAVGSGAAATGDTAASGLNAVNKSIPTSIETLSAPIPTGIDSLGINGSQALNSSIPNNFSAMQGSGGVSDLGYINPSTSTVNNFATMPNALPPSGITGPGATALNNFAPASGFGGNTADMGTAFNQGTINAGKQAMTPSLQTATTPTSSIFANGQPLSMVGDLGQSYNKLGATGKALTAGGVGLGTSMALNSLTTPDTTLPVKEQPKSQFTTSYPTSYNYDPLKYKPNVPSWTVYPTSYMASGGITDLDGFGSQAQNTPTPGTLNVPNMNEVADPEGYGGESARLMAQGGIADLGGYANGGIPNLLHGPGDGVSDDIPASIADKQPARLASGEYVVPSRIVSELGNGSTDAGAKRLDMMVQKVNAGRAKTLGGKKYAKDTKPYKHLPV